MTESIEWLSLGHIAERYDYRRVVSYSRAAVWDFNNDDAADEHDFPNDAYELANIDNSGEGGLEEWLE